MISDLSLLFIEERLRLSARLAIPALLALSLFGLQPICPAARASAEDYNIHGQGPPVEPGVSMDGVKAAVEPCATTVSRFAKNLVGVQPTFVGSHQHRGFLAVLPVGLLFVEYQDHPATDAPYAHSCAGAPTTLTLDWKDRNKPLILTPSFGTFKSVKISPESWQDDLTVRATSGDVLNNKLTGHPTSITLVDRAIVLRYRRYLCEREHTGIMNGERVEFIDRVLEKDSHLFWEPAIGSVGGICVDS